MFYSVAFIIVIFFLPQLWWGAGGVYVTMISSVTSSKEKNYLPFSGKQD